MGTGVPAPGGGTLVLVDDIALQRRQEESAKASAGRIGGTDIVAFEQTGEEPLRQILGLFAVVSTTPQIAVERRPVYLAAARRRRRRLDRIAAAA